MSSDDLRERVERLIEMAFRRSDVLGIPYDRAAISIRELQAVLDQKVL